MKSKVLFISALVCIIFSGLYTVSYALELNEPRVNTLTGEISIDGADESGLFGKPLILKVYNGNTLYYIDCCETVKNGVENTFAFSAWKPVLSLPSGTYNVYVYSNITDEAAEASFEYSSVKDIYTLMKTLAQADEETFLSTVSGISENIFASAKEISGLSSEAKGKLYANMRKISTALPGSCETEKELKKTREEYIKYSKEIEDAVGMAKFTDLKQKRTADVKEWIDTYIPYFDIENDNPATAADEGELYKYFEKVKTNTEFLESLKNCSLESFSVDELQNKIYEKVSMSIIRTGAVNEVTKYLNKFESLFSFDKVQLGKLSKVKQDEVCSFICGKAYEGYEAVKYAFDGKVKEIVDALENKMPEHGGSGGGGGVVPSKAPNAEKNADKPGTEASSVSAFKDMSGHRWAEEAVNYLYGRKIIIGKGNQEFAPSDSLTRAEAVKIIITAAEKSLSGNDSVFDDVAADSWYGVYVSSAFRIGIVSGVSERSFAPELNITRQDFAVMIYRGFAINSKEDAMNFDDGAEIDEYAKKAVSALSENKIVLGNDENKFEPKRNITRAEAAVVIYRIVCENGK